MDRVNSTAELPWFVVRLSKEFGQCDLALDEYLENLLNLAARWRDNAAIPASDFAELLRDAFSTPGNQNTDLDAGGAAGFAGFRNIIRRQIQDLADLNRSGGLDNKYRELGLITPNGESWYNFDPILFIECGVAGLSAHCPDANDELCWQELILFLECGQMYE